MTDRQGGTIARNTIWLVAADAGRRGSVVLTTALLARGLGVEGFGQYALAQTFNLALAPLLQFGLSTLSVREMARERSRIAFYVPRIFAMQLLLCIAYLALVAAAVSLLRFPGPLRLLVYLQAGWIASIALSHVLRRPFWAVEQMKYEAVLEPLFGVVRLALVALTLGAGMSIGWVGSSDFLAGLVILVVALSLFAKHFGRPSMVFDGRLARSWLGPMIPLAGLLTAATLFGRIDSVILSKLSGDMSVGVYEASLRLVVMLNFVTMYAVQATYPRMSRVLMPGSAGLSPLVGRVARAVFAIALLSALLVTMFAPLAIALLYGATFAPSVLPLRLLSWTLPPYALAYTAMYVLIAHNREALALRPTGIALAVHVVADLILIPLLGPVGAAIAGVISITAWCILLGGYCLLRGYVRAEDLRPRRDDWRSLRSIVASAGRRRRPPAVTARIRPEFTKAGE